MYVIWDIPWCLPLLRCPLSESSPSGKAVRKTPASKVAFCAEMYYTKEASQNKFAGFRTGMRIYTGVLLLKVQIYFQTIPKQETERLPPIVKNSEKCFTETRKPF
jgi:hypothetical protein